MDISAEAKGIAYYNVVTNDEGRQMIDTLLKYGCDYGKAYDFCHTLDICKAVGIEYPNKAVFFVYAAICFSMSVMISSAVVFIISIDFFNSFISLFLLQPATYAKE